MNIAYNVDEVFEIAEQIERNGSAFYRSAAELSGPGATADLFRTLAEQEDDHLRTFAGMRKKLVPAESSIAINDKDEIMAIYLRALAGQQIFNTAEKAEDLLAGNESVADILRMAIGKERNSIIYYAALRSLMKDAGEQKTIEQIIREEQKHVDDLNAELENVK